MKIRLFAALMIALMLVSLFAGCQTSSPISQPDAPGTTEIAPEEIPLVASVSTPTEAAPERITPEAAEEIALTHAGLTADQLSYMRTEFDYDDGRPEYDIEFRHDGWEYDYEIHAVTGEILRSEAEPPKEQKASASPEQKAATEPPATQPPSTEAPAAQAERLTEAEAEAIALAHAGLSADQVKNLHTKFDYDDGRPEYDIEFYFDGREYDYEIHAETGKILDWDKDRDD